MSSDLIFCNLPALDCSEADDFEYMYHKGKALGVDNIIFQRIIFFVRSKIRTLNFERL